MEAFDRSRRDLETRELFPSQPEGVGCPGSRNPEAEGLAVGILHPVRTFCLDRLDSAGHDLSLQPLGTTS